MQLTQEEVLYTARTTTAGGRVGASKSSDGNLDIKFSEPGSKVPGTNPEQLFAAGWSACFIGAMGFVAGSKRIRLPEDTTVHAEVDLVRDGKEYSLSARLNISIPGIETSVAQEIADEAGKVCPYSKAVRNNIPVRIHVV